MADPAEISGLSPFIGCLSQVGLLCWSATASVCFLGFTIFRQNSSAEARKFGQFLKYSGFFSTVLLLDDSFQLHEMFASGSIYLLGFESYQDHLQSIGEALIYLLYTCLLMVLLKTFRKIILKTNFLMMILALGLFVLSIIFDVLTPETMLGHYIIEEGLKFLGIATWLFYYFELCSTRIAVGIQAKLE